MEVKTARPLWHVGGKWAAGILLWCILGTTLLLWALVRMTAPGPAIEAMTMATALSLSPGGLDDPGDIDQIRRQAAAAPGGVFKPIPGLKIAIKAEDLEGRSPRELRLLLFRQLAEPIYYEGDAGLTALAETEEMRNNIQGGVGALGVLGAAAHRTLQRALLIAAGVCLLPLLLLVLFGHGFGRLYAPGLVLLLAALPGAVVIPRALGALAAMPASTHPAHGGSSMDMLALTAQGALPPLLHTAQGVFTAPLAAGALLLAAGAAGAARRWWRQGRTAAAFPHWQADVRWTAGLLLVLVLQVALADYNLVQMTAPEPAVQSLRTSLGLILGPEDPAEPTAVQRLRREGPQVFYDEGEAGLLRLAETPELQRQIQGNAAYASLLTRGSHDRLSRPLPLLGGATLVLLAALIFFSPGFRRLSTPGWALLLGSLPGLAIFGALSGMGGDGEAPAEVSAGAIIGGALQPGLQAASRRYGLLMQIAALLILLALLGRIVWWVVGRLRQRHARSGKAAAS